ncbi:MAG: methionine adenosyltransferase domain-containing protein, partial [Candidatus Thalassarchaeaceae archaeon]|nr:methionine adenosyltransferase domain-containing protein [Candidatus Thalassarchaeaceae archaeon]
VSQPVSVFVNTLGTGTIDDHTLSKRVEGAFDFRPQAIIEALNLRSPIYSRTASGGHFGRTPSPEGEFSWEKLDDGKIESLQG